MSNLKHWQHKMKQKRKSTDFRRFLMEIASWSGMAFYRNNWLISKYPESDRIKISSIKDYEDKVDEAIDYWNDYDFGKNGFENFQKLFRSMNHSCVSHIWKNEQCEYSDVAVTSKNAYLSRIITLWSENVFYSMLVRINSKNVFNSLFVVDNSEVIYFCKSVHSSYKIFYSKYIKNCSDIWFSTNLTWCKDCLFCHDLENASYCINNQQYSKEQYLEKKTELLKDKQKFLSYYDALENKWKNHNSTNVSGDNIIESEEVSNGSFVFNLKNWNNTLFVWSTAGAENWYDFLVGWEWNNDIYGVSNSGWNCSNIYNSVQISWSTDIYYSQNIETSSHLLFCNGLKNKQYCILNKQYTKYDWETLAGKIFTQMEEDWIFWEFFPGELNPFYFNDTIAWMIWNFTKEEVEAKWYMWRDEEIKVDIPASNDIISIDELNDYEWYSPEWEWRINPEILKKVIRDSEWNYYRIIKMEYDFLVKHALPLPRLHWLERMKINFWTHK